MLHAVRSPFEVSVLEEKTSKAISSQVTLWGVSVGRGHKQMLQAVKSHFGPSLFM